ncbi:MAG: hypothetical protein QW096_10870 [Thermofilaceae archaeon]
MFKPCIFFFSGVDGSGKSTHAKLLRVYARKKGLKVRYMWLRWSPFLTYILLFYSLIRRRTLKITFTRRGRRYTFKVHVFWIDPVLKTLYPRVFLFDSLLRYLLELVSSYMGHLDLIIFDRFFLDIIIDLLWETRNTAVFRYIEVKAVLGLLNKYKHCGLVLFADPLMIINRKADVISFREIKFKCNVFKLLTRVLNLEAIDTTSVSISEAFNIVVRRFHECVHE